MNILAASTDVMPLYKDIPVNTFLHIMPLLAGILFAIGITFMVIDSVKGDENENRVWWIGGGSLGGIVVLLVAVVIMASLTHTNDEQNETSVKVYIQAKYDLTVTDEDIVSEELPLGTFEVGESTLAEIAKVTDSKGETFNVELRPNADRTNIEVLKLAPTKISEK